MTDHKFTDDEIIKMLKSIDDVGDCSRDCIFYDGKVHHCASVFAHHALEVIDRQKNALEREIYNGLKADEEIEHLKVEIESLKIANEKMYAANKEQEAEIESLKKNGDYKTSDVLRHDAAIRELHKRLDTTKSEAIKEFAKNVKKHFYQAELIEYIDSLVEEVEMGAR